MYKTTTNITNMTTQVYEELFLVNNIPEFEGIQEVSDMIKGYAYTSEMYMIRDMELARNFAYKFKLVNYAIRQAMSRKNSDKYIENYDDEEHWGFGYERYDPYEIKNCDMGYQFINGNLIHHIETLQIQAVNCYICGEYVHTDTRCKYYPYTLPFCNCYREL
uniref:Uncharacterized protein n=1 Tax=viral metagenome TaxID=1070528 RepID=A0A6C0HTN2_9ZZZZ